MKRIFCFLIAANMMLTAFSGSELISNINIATQAVTENVEIIKANKEEAERIAYEKSLEMNGVWVATVRNVDYPTTEGTTSSAVLKEQADAIIDTCARIGIDNIFLQVRPTCDALYKSSIFPWSRYLTGAQGVAPDNDFDPLEYWVKQAHAKDIKIHAWVNPYRVTRDNDAADTEWNNLIADSNPAKQHPEWLIRHDNNYYFDPGIPEVRQLVLDGIMEIVNNYDVDGIHFDDYFYPNENQGAIYDDASFAAYGSGYSSKAEWRRDNVNTLVKAIGPAIKAVKPGIVFGISPSGIWANKTSMSAGSNTKGMEHYRSLFADSRKWIKEEWVDYIAPQLYWSIGYDKADYKILVKWWADQCEGTDTKLYIGMGDYRTFASSSSSEWYGEAGVNMIKRELELNDTYEIIKGEIHYNFSSVRDNTALQNMLIEYYK